MIKVKRGLDVPITGQPMQSISSVHQVSSVALVGADYPGLQPTMKVAEGDCVIQGQVLLRIKRIPLLRIPHLFLVWLKRFIAVHVVFFNHW